jgi:hypothetical protein
MTTVTTDSFLREVVTYCPDAMELVALNAIVNACIEFCRVSTIHRIDMTALDGVAGQEEYTITVPTDTQLATVIQLSYNGLKLVPKSMEELTAYYRYEDWDTIQGQPAFFTQITPGAVRLVPYPDTNATGALTGRISLMPTRSATTVYDELYNRYFEDIALGARSRLHYTPATSYYDPAMAEQCKMRFDNAKNNALSRANKGQSRAMVRVLYNKF